MQASTHLPDPAALRCDQVTITPGFILLVVTAITPLAICPCCGQPAGRIHSRYLRTLTDLPWHGTPVRLQIRARRFFCDQPACPRRIFTERLPKVTCAHARKTARLSEALDAIGFALGGEAGARLADRLSMNVSPDTLLRRIRRASPATSPAPRVLGVDDWAWRRGQRYGTILCDLERRCPVDLLSDRSDQSFSAWLQAHPGVQIISRDRAGCYAAGSAAGAPGAVQVADRWHLLRNLRDALIKLLERHHRDLRNVARSMTEAAEALVSTQPPPDLPDRPAQPKRREQQTQDANRARRLERYQEIMGLHEQGLTGRAIGRKLGLNRETVQRYLHAGGFPERAARFYPRLADPFGDYIRRRWQEGCRNAAQIARELAVQGYRGSRYTVQRWVAHWRSGESALPSSVDSAHPPSVRRVAWALIQPEDDLTPEDRAFRNALWQHCPEMRAAADLANSFRKMVREHASGELEGWIDRASSEGTPRELQGFAKGLRSDLAAVRNALKLTWSNGPVEGQVNRLKLIKRQMYGRAGFDLLRQRVLHSG